MNSNGQNNNKIISEKNKPSLNDKQKVTHNLMKANTFSNGNVPKKGIKLTENIEEKKKDQIQENKTLKENKINNDAFEDIDDDFVKDIIEQEKKEEEGDDDDFIDLDRPLSYSDIDPNKIKLNLWEIIPISSSIKKTAKSGLMKNIVSTIVYNGIKTNDKFNPATKKPIILYDKLQNNKEEDVFKKMQESFIYMSYRTGLVNTSFLPGGKNNYTSDCGWGCMLRCCQMMLSRGFIKMKKHQFKVSNPGDKKMDIMKVRKELIFLFYDKFIELTNIPHNEQIFEIYRQLLKDKYDVTEIIAPYSIYVLTLLGKCPNVFTSDYKMISCFLKINKILFKDYIRMIHFKNAYIKIIKIFQTFCKKIENEEKEKEIPKENIIEYKSDKYVFDKGGLIFISLRLGLHKIEANYLEMVPKLFNNLHNNIGFVSGKKKRAFYFIGMKGEKLIFADPHFNQNLELDENNFPTYKVNELYKTTTKELSSELTVGVAIFSKEELDQFLLDLEWFKQICPYFIKYD